MLKKDKEIGIKSIAVFLICTLFFAIAVEAFHNHQSERNQITDNPNFVKYAPQCLICEVVFNNINSNFTPQNAEFELNPPIEFISIPVDTYQIGFIETTYFQLPNKDPPTLLFTV